MKSISKKTMLTLGATGALALGIAAPAVAYAADSGSAQPSSTTQDQNQPDGRPHGPDQADQAKFAAALADALGIDKQKVADALTKVREQFQAKHQQDGAAQQDPQNQADRAANRQAQLKERLDQAVKDGKITQDEEDAVLKAFEAHVLMGGPGMKGGPGNGSDNGQGAH